ncbi:MAG TPA: helicase-related protein, partial [Sphingobacteriaceae bacterium]|nr:helicase-related protein [Sphingobacteriaceae bacterium]
MVVCTSSLDLGVDFRPVDTVVQVGSPKGIARFLQRAGRSGHQPGALSTIYFLPTHSLEIMEGASLKYAVEKGMVENRLPFIRSFDVLIQYMLTLAVSEGFDANTIFEEVTKTHCFESISREEFNECLLLLVKGGKTLDAYDEFYKVEKIDGLYKVTDKKIAMRHRMSIGAIVSDAMMQVKFLSGKYLGSIEESFISRLKPGDTFWFSGRSLELIRVKYMEVVVRASSKKSGTIPSWMGGRFPISANLGAALRHTFKEVHYKDSTKKSPEVRFLQPLFAEQSRRSYLPKENELLLEYIQTKYGHHLFIYIFEGKFVHEGMAAVLAYRLSKIKKMTFSIATNEYGIELLSDEAIPISEEILEELFSTKEIHLDIQNGINTTEMARRQFREIAGISGLVFKGYPGKHIKTKHLQANAGLFFSVFEDYEKDNLLLRQAYDEVFTFQLEIARMYAAFKRIETHKIILKTLKKL